MPPTDRSRWLNLAAIVLLCLLLTGVGMLTPVMRLVDAIGGVTWRRPLDAGWAPALLLADALVLPVIFAIGIIFWVSVARDSEIDRTVSDEVVVRWRTSVPIRFAFNLMAVGFALMIVYVLIGVSVVLSKDRPADGDALLGALTALFVPLALVGIIWMLRLGRIRLEVRGGVFTSVGFVRTMRFHIRSVHRVEARPSGLTTRLVVVTTSGAIHGITIPPARGLTPRHDVEALAAEVDRQLVNARSSFASP